MSLSKLQPGNYDHMLHEGVGKEFVLHPIVHIFGFWGLGTKCWDKTL
jgi:hypothetical protein